MPTYCDIWRIFKDVSGLKHIIRDKEVVGLSENAYGTVVHLKGGFRFIINDPIDYTAKALNIKEENHG